MYPIRSLFLVGGLSAGFLQLGACDAPRTGASSLSLSVLGTAQAFTVLGGSAVTNTGATTIVGDVGVNPGTSVTGFPPGMVSGGVIHGADAVTLQAQNDVTTAYTTLAGLPCDHDMTGQDLGGRTLTAGVYCFSSSAQLTGTLTLDAQSNPNAVFVFQTVSTLTTASGAGVLMINGGLPCNTFWKVGSSAALGTTTTFVGSILALTSISLATGARVFGRALARNGAVTLDSNHLEPGTCATDGGVADASVIDAGAADVGATDAGALDVAVATDSGPIDAATQPDAVIVDASADVPVDTQVADGGCCVGVACGGACVDLTVDRTNCGSCGHTCAASQFCSAMTCVTCSTLCGGSCADIATDHDNCGACGVACSATQACIDGACGACVDGTLCEGSCADFQTDTFNCGSCGHACSLGAHCISGNCVAACP